MVCVCFSEWIQEYYQQYPDSTNLQAEIDEFMAKFDENKEQVCIIPGVMLTSHQSFFKKKKAHNLTLRTSVCSKKNVI